MSDWRRIGVREVGCAIGVLAAVAITGTQVSGALKWSARVLVALYVVAGVAAVGSILVDWFLSRRRTREDWESQMASALAGWCPRQGHLPTIETLAPYAVGVSPSRYGPGSDPYVRREEVDDWLDKRLRIHSFVLVDGNSKAGKSRTAFEAMQRAFPTAKLLIPKARPGALQTLFALDPPVYRGTETVVLWLDDIERYLRIEEGLDADLLRQATTSGVVVATIKSKERDALFATEGDIGRSARAVLDEAADIDLPSNASDGELSQARDFYPTEVFTRGIGEQLVAAPELERKYRDGRESHPAGWSVVQAAIDWSRAGMPRPIAKPTLQGLYPAYLRTLRRDIDASDAIFEEGLAWAREPVAAHIALLDIRDEGEPRTFAAFDYIVAYADGQSGYHGEDVLDAAWYTAIELGDASDRFTIGLVAYARGAHTFAANAWRRMAPDHILLSAEEDPKGAAVAFKRAIDSGEFRDPGIYLTVDSITDPSGVPVELIDVDLGFTVSGTLVLPNWLAGTVTVCIYADELGGPFDGALSPCATLELVPAVTEPNPKVYPWSIAFSGGVLPDTTSGSQIFSLSAKVSYRGHATDFHGYVEMGTYLVD
jgi:hypothetical protein